ncbi:MAG: HK97 family phage prohead protease [Coprobacillus sp.]|nr:HK97 family phage prohead protease [Coprobacillus sp.]
MGILKRLRRKPKMTRAKNDEKERTRELNGSIRALEGEGNERKFEISFSSEEPYDRGWCIEILDHAEGAADLTRLNEIGVVLYNHNRDDVLGRINRAWIEDGRGKAEIEFDDDEMAETIYQKVKSGTLKGVSVGYIINSIEEVAAGKTSADGRFTGPCEIARTWEPLEVSIASVPADPTVGVGREYQAPETDNHVKCAPSISARQLQININKLL